MLGIQFLIVEEKTGYICRRVLRRRADGPPSLDIRYLICPYNERTTCTLDCALLAGETDRGGRLLLVCRGSGTAKILGLPDPDRTDLDELAALTAASDAAG